MNRWSWARRLGRIVGGRRFSSQRGARRRGVGTTGVHVHPLESRQLLSAAHDLIGVTAMRNDPAFAGIDGSGVSVAVIDTGVDFSHPLLSGGRVAGLDVVFGGDVPTPVDPHGTHVAGIVGARDANIGVAPGVGLVGIQVFTPSGNGQPLAYNTHTEAALAWVLQNRERYNIVAVNMSLGGGNYTSADQVNGDIRIDDVQRLEAAGVTVVSAAGNSYGDLQTAGSGAPGVFSTLNVGAVWEENEGGRQFGNAADRTTGPDRITVFSQRPSTSNVIFAPGAMILSTVPDNGFEEMPGTSMASPMVAGVVALMQEAALQFGGRLLTPQEVRGVIQETADIVGDGDDEDTTVQTTGGNYPRVNAYRAVQFIRNAFAGPGPGPDPGPDPTPDPDPVDPNGTIASAISGPSLSGSPVEAIDGAVGPDGASDIGDNDVDLVRFQVLAPGTVTLATSGSFDSFLRLFDSSGNQIAFDDDANGDLGARISTTLGAGTYYAGVSAAGNTSYDPNVAGSGPAGGSVGNYSLSFALSSADPNGLLSGAVPLNLGGRGVEVVAGLIGSDFGVAVGSSDVDIFEILVPDDGTLFIDIDTPQVGFVDSFLRIFDADGNEIVDSDDDRAPDEFEHPTDAELVTDAAGAVVGRRTDSFVGGTVSRGDVYYVAVSDFQNQGYDPATLSGRSPAGPGGEYSLNVGFLNRDLNGSIDQALVATALPVSAAGFIGADGNPDTGGLDQVGDRDVDFVRINSPTAGILEAVVASTTVAENEEPVDTVLRLFDSAGNLVAFNDDAEGLDPILRYEIAAGVDYYIAVAGFGNDTFDPFVLGSGSPGATGAYGFAAGVRPLSDEGQLADDAAPNGGVGDVVLGFPRNGFVGEDRGYVRGAADVDLYRFHADGAGTVQITAIPADDFGADPFLRLFDASGNELASDDNGGGNSRGSVISTHVNPGTYYVGVSGAGPLARSYNPLTGEGAGAGSTGSYTLSVTGALGPPPPTVGPDFVVASVVPAVKPGAVIGGQTRGRATVLVRNQGNEPSLGNANVRLFLSADQDLDAADTHVVTLPPKPLRLKVNAVRRMNANFVFPAGVADGSYFLLAQVDENGGVSEMNEGNNVGSSGAAVAVAAPFVDFGVSFGPGAPTALAAGQRGQITLLVRNAGNVAAKGSLPLRLLASADNVLDAGDAVLAPLTMKLNVRAGATKVLRLRFPMPALTPGSYFFIADLDAGSLPERNDSDNVAVSPGQFAAS